MYDDWMPDKFAYPFLRAKVGSMDSLLTYETLKRSFTRTTSIVDASLFYLQARI